MGYNVTACTGGNLLALPESSLFLSDKVHALTYY